MNVAYDSLQENLGKEWGWIALRGAVTFIFGSLAFMWPLLTLWTLALIWGGFAFTDGMLSFLTALRLHQQGSSWWAYLVLGLLGLMAGVVIYIWPGLTTVNQITVIAFWAVLAGVSQVLAGTRLRKKIDDGWLLVLSGLAGIFFGLLILSRPLPLGAIAITGLAIAYALIIGTLHILFAFKVKSFNE